MFKYPKFTLPFFLVGIVIIIFTEKIKSSEYEKDEKLLHNNVFIKGVVTSRNISNNHCFAIIFVRNTNTSISHLKPKIDEELYLPYAINKEYSEVYTPSCEIEEIDQGDTIILNSNSKTVAIKHLDKVSKWNIKMVNEQYNIKFIKENTTLFE